MKKSDLKHGNVVELRNCDMMIVNVSSFDIELVSFDEDELEFEFEHDLRTRYNDDLTHKTNKEFDIINIYENMAILYDKSIEPIFERDLIKELIKGDLVWVSDDSGEDKEWQLKKFIEIDEDSKNCKYVVCQIFHNKFDSCKYGYKYIRPARVEDLQFLG